MQTDGRLAPESRKTGSLKLRAGSWMPWLVFGGAALVALVLYLPTLRYDFVWDDRMLVLRNPFLDQASPAELFAKGFWNNPAMRRGEDYLSYYRPLTNLSLYVDRKVWGIQPAGYHLTNIIVNSAVVFIMCLVLWEVFGSAWLAGLGGLLLGIHPAMNCVVTFISNRTYLLALLFLLVSSYALLRGRRDRARAWPALLGLSLLSSALALEAALVFALLAAGWLLVERTRYRRLWMWVVAIASPVTVYFLLRLGIARVPFTGSGPVMYRAITEPLRIINSFGQQLQILFFPFNQKVIYIATKPFTSFSVYTVLGLLLLGLPLYALVRLGRSATRHRDTHGTNSDPERRHSVQPGVETGHLGWYGYAWMVLLLLPFAYLVFLGPAGRMLYLAAPGVLILLAALYMSTRRRRLTGRVLYGAMLLYAAAFAVQTHRRNPIWRNKLSLSETMVREAPGSVTAHTSYGLALADAGRKAEAVEQLRIVLETDPRLVEPRIGLAYALIDLGDLPSAIRELREVARLRPESPTIRNELALALLRNGQPDSAITEYKEALRLDPNSAATLDDLGYACMVKGDPRQAIRFLKDALRLSPDDAVTRANLATAYRAAGMPDSAALVEDNRQ